jgi:hypothetical protein
MKLFQTTFLTRLSTVMLITTFGTLGVSASSPGTPLKIGDEYGGGKIALILGPGEPGYAEIAEQFVIASHEEISETDKWPETQKVSDKGEVSDHYDIYLQSKVQQRQVAVGRYSR